MSSYQFIHTNDGVKHLVVKSKFNNAWVYHDMSEMAERKTLHAQFVAAGLSSANAWFQTFKLMPLKTVQDQYLNQLIIN